MEFKLSFEPTRGPLGDAVADDSLNQKVLLITFRSLKQHLDRFVVGQDKSKRILSTAIYHHYHRVQQLRRREEEEEEFWLVTTATSIRSSYLIYRVQDEFPVETKRGSGTMTDISSDNGNLLHDDTPLTIEKSNVLCLGPTGVGKTLMVRTLARILNVPFSMFIRSDCTPFTMAGYVGEDVDQAVHRLLAAAGHDVRRAETGIICLDEFDKIAKPKSMHGTKDISGEGVQQALLKIIEGTTLQITTKPERRPPQGLPNNPSPGSFNSQGLGGASPKGEKVTIDTSSILFIFTGAFIGLDKIIADRVSKGSMGFNAHVRGASLKDLSNDSKLAQTVNSYNYPEKDPLGARGTLNPLDLTEPGDLISFGLIPEIVGRIPVTTAVEALTEEMLVRVLIEPRNSLLKQYEKLFNLSGVELRFTSPALLEIAKSALGMGTGARGLRTVVERLLSDAMFESPGTSIKHVLVNKSVAQKKQPPLYFSRGQRHTLLEMISVEEGEWVARGNKIVVQENDPIDEASAAAKERAAGSA
ncbi:putative ATP-dependent Clp protease [Geopyxis carbonaria]|nr:putative ATP-dependent Clp protease [Geopyxis carbonaria]